MTNRNFDAEFSAMMVPLAADDAELVDFYQARIHGTPFEQPESVELLQSTIMEQYALDSLSYSRAVGKCVANIVGIQTGVDIFNG